MLSPPSVKEKASDNGSRSGTSQGSHVGRNKVYVPHLSFPDDINVDPREKRQVIAKPKGDSRFHLKKSTSTSVAGTKKAYGKKSKMLEVNLTQDAADLRLQDEPVEEERCMASRGQPALDKHRSQM